MVKVWFVTGALSGLGRDIALAALSAGDCVSVAARQSTQVGPEFEHFGDRIRILRMDVKDEAAARHAIGETKDAFGRLDVLVNNAGFGKFGSFEEMSPEDFREVVDVNFFGAVHTTRAAIPIMREQGQGKVFQISSIAGRLAMPGNSPYVAAKHAVGGFSDALRTEVEPLGIQICVLEPGGIRTDWSRRASVDSATTVLPAYEPTVGAMLKRLKESDGQQENDPKSIATLILQLATQEEIPQRLVLGSTALKAVVNAEDQRRKERQLFEGLSLSTTFESQK